MIIFIFNVILKCVPAEMINAYKVFYLNFKNKHLSKRYLFPC